MVGILLYEAYAWLPKISAWLIESAVRRLPQEIQARCREEWTANLDALPNTTLRLWHAVSICQVADKIAFDTFEAQFHYIEHSLNELGQHHDRQLDEIRMIKTDAARNTSSRENLKHRLDDLVTFARAQARPRRLTGPPAGQEAAIQSLAQSLERFAYAMTAALDRAGDLMTANIRAVSARLDQADNRLKGIFEKHARTSELFRGQELVRLVETDFWVS